jgi:hypothetical protein
MVQRLYADVIPDAIWFMNIHEQNHPWFLAMRYNVIKFVIDLPAVGGFPMVLRFPPPIKLTTTI